MILHDCDLNDTMNWAIVPALCSTNQLKNIPEIYFIAGLIRKLTGYGSVSVQWVPLQFCRTRHFVHYVELYVTSDTKPTTFFIGNKNVYHL